MTWLVAVGGHRPRRRPESGDVQTSVKCGACERSIGVGDVYALVTDAQLKRCAECALAIVRAWVQADWDKAGWCPWPSQLEAETTRRVGVAMETAQTDAVAVVDFGGRLNAAIERSRRAA